MEQVSDIHDELMHACSIVSHGIDVVQLLPQVVCIQHCVGGRFRNALLAKGHDIGQGPDDDQEVSVEHLDSAHGLVCNGVMISVLVLADAITRQEVLQEVLASYRAAARSSAAVGRGECLVQVDVNAVESHVAGAYNAHDSIQVRAVVVAQAACLVDDAGDLCDVLIEESYCVRVCQHQSGCVVADRCLQRFQVNASVLCGRNAYDLKSAHGCAGGVGAVGRVRNDDLVPLGVAPVCMVGLDEKQSGEFAVGACSRLEGKFIHAGDFCQRVLQLLHHCHGTLNGLLVLQGVYPVKAGQGGSFFIHFGIVFHGAGTQRIEPVVHTVSTLCQFGIMSADLVLRKLGQMGCSCS